ncbi:MAG: Mur ligase family protein [Deltaproteobacteria bacterium]|nr:Mur ligase family protein [Deltaproteobacteria bacterium]
MLVAGTDCETVRELLSSASCRIVSFAVDRDANIGAADVIVEDRRMRFTLTVEGKPGMTVETGLVGQHNLKNILAAYALARDLGVTDEAFTGAVSQFRGVFRRQQVFGEAGGVTIIDDFAHHPTAVAETLAALAKTWSGRRLVVLFEPRTNTTRRKFFQNRYAEVFGDAAELVIAPVFGLDQIPGDERFDPHRLANDVADRGTPSTYAESYDATLAAALERLRPNDVAVLLSNGGFGGMHGRLLDALREREGRV